METPRRSRWRRALAALVLLLGLVLAAAVVRAVRLPSRQLAPTGAPLVAVDAAASAQRLAAALRIPTVSSEGPAEPAAFDRLHAHLAASFPRMHATLARELLPGGSVIYTWAGRDPSAEPVVLTGHLDVVPIDASARWAHAPFAGDVDGTFVHGRGALDDKGAVLALCEAVEALLAKGHAPSRTVILAFGHDEELGGGAGAARIAERLAQKGVKPELVLDEGFAIVDGLVPGVAGPVALVGVSEKGSLTVELKVQLEGGHSSMPAREGAVGVLAGALQRLEAHPLPASLTGVARRMFDRLAPEMPFGYRLVFGNPWLFGPLVERQLEARPSTAALLRTTTALTVVQAGVKENVIPTSARALANFRLLPGNSAADVVAHVRRVVDDARVSVQPREAVEASTVAPDEGPAFDALAQAIRDVVPDATVAPGLVLGQTDGRHYQRLGGPVYRFAPYRLGPDDLARVHGTDERLRVEDHVRAIRIYARLLELAG